MSLPADSKLESNSDICNGDQDLMEENTSETDDSSGIQNEVHKSCEIIGNIDKLRSVNVECTDSMWEMKINDHGLTPVEPSFNLEEVSQDSVCNFIADSTVSLDINNFVHVDKKTLKLCKGNTNGECGENSLKIKFNGSPTECSTQSTMDSANDTFLETSYYSQLSPLCTNLDLLSSHNEIFDINSKPQIFNNIENHINNETALTLFDTNDSSLLNSKSENNVCIFSNEDTKSFELKLSQVTEDNNSEISAYQSESLNSLLPNFSQVTENDDNLSKCCSENNDADDESSEELGIESQSLNHMLSACSLIEDNSGNKLSHSKTGSDTNITFINSDMKEVEDVIKEANDVAINESSICSDDDNDSFNLDFPDLDKNNKNNGIPLNLEENLLGYAQTFSSELEKNLYSSSLGLEDIINAAVNEIGLELNKEKDLQEHFLSLDSDSNMATASEGIVSSCSPSASSENSQQVSDTTSTSFPLRYLPEASQDSSLEEGQGSSEERESFGKRGDADGCSLSNSDEPNKGGDNNAGEDQHIFIGAKKLEFGEENNQCEESDTVSNCSCKRSEVLPYEENGSVLLGAWGELRSSLRQLHRSVVPSSLTKSGLSNPRNRPSINRIKALTNMLLAHDPHQLFTRVNQLSQELCIELKVRLLASIHDSPDFEEASAFIRGLCESYEWVINVCEAIQIAFEKLDSEHLSRFGLNWMTVNMHTFYTTIFTDPDVQDYLSICSSRAEESSEGNDILGCLASLKRTLTVAEGVWTRAENHLHEYAMERSALNAQRRQMLSGWGQLKSRQPPYQKFPTQNFAMHNHMSFNKDSKETVENGLSDITPFGETSWQQCPCSECHTLGAKEHSASSSQKDSNIDSVNDLPRGCECHFCNSSNIQSQTSSSVLSTPSSGVLPPLTQPQLSLYPHIHGTSACSDIVSNQGLEDLGPLPTSTSSKPPIFANPYLGSDLLTEQLIREWDLAYGDALTPPGGQPMTSVSNVAIDDSSGLANSLENLNLTSRPNYAHHMIDHNISQTTTMASSTGFRISRDNSTSSQISPTHNLSQTFVSSSVAHSNVNNGIVSSKATSNIPNNTSIKAENANQHPQAQSKCQKQQLQQMLLQKQQLTSNASVITHTKNCTNTTARVPNSKNECLKSDAKQRNICRSVERSTSRETNSDSDSSGPDEWSSGDEDSDASSTGSSTNHQDSHCDCCYCHMLQNKPGGGRQKYSDRRERLLKILSHKKQASPAASSLSSSTASSTVNNSICPSNNAAPPSSVVHSNAKPADNPIGHQTLDEIINYIEGKRSDSKCDKKAAKKARQKERKLAIKQQEEIKNSGDKSTDSEERMLDENVYCDEESEENEEEEEEDEEEEEEEEEDEEEEEEEEDGPLAELRRRAPDVTITVVRPGQKQNQRTMKNQTSLSRDHGPSPSGSKHPLVAKALPQTNHSNNSMWNSPRTVLPSGHLSSSGHMSLSKMSPMGSKEINPSPMSGSSTGGLSTLLKGMESLTKDQDSDKDGKSSQMVTIRRVMDPVSSEPTVTITLKGEEPKKDKVLFKLVNGQACPGGNAKGTKNNQPIPKPKVPQERPVYNIPEGTDPEEAKRMKKKQKKERQKLRKEQEKLEEEQQEQMKQLQLQKQQEYLKQQEAHIRKQQAALQRQQDELKRQHNKNQTEQGKKKKGKKGKATVNNNNNNNNNNNKDTKGKSKNVSAVVYDGDDVARNFSLPPGVSINKVAGQPGMVTISNNMGNHFPQPFLPNPNIYQNSILQGYPMGSAGNSAGYGMSPSNSSMGYPGMYGGCAPAMPWNSSLDPCSGSPQESVIVVDTNSGVTSAKGSLHGNSSSLFSATNSSSHSIKTPEEMTSEEKIEAAVRGEIDISILNQTQKKKYKKILKTIRLEKESAVQKQQEEDELMDRMYEMAKGQLPKVAKETNNETKVAGNKKTNKCKEGSRSLSSNHSASSTNNVKQVQHTAKGDKNQVKNSKQTQNSNNSQSVAKSKLNTNSTTRKGNENKQNVKETKNIIGKQQLNEQHSRQPQIQKQPHQKQTHTQQKTQPSQQKQQLQNSQQKMQVQPKQQQQQIQPKLQQTLNKQQLQPKQKIQSQQKNLQQSHQNQKHQLQQTPQQINQQQHTSQQKNQQLHAPQTKNQQQHAPQQKQQQPLQKQKPQLQQKQQQQPQPLQEKQSLQKQLSQQLQQKPQSQQKQQQQPQQTKKLLQKQQILNKHETNDMKHLQEINSSQIKQQLFVSTNQITQSNQMHLNKEHHHFNSLQNPNIKTVRLQPNFKGKLLNADPAHIYPQKICCEDPIKTLGSYGPTVGYASSDIGHEARYAQYLAANASTLASVEYEANNSPLRPVDGADENCRRKGKKKGKKGHLEDLTTIDSVFTPKELPSGELDDETDREVEAFKRFCLYNVPRNVGEKPKVNFNVKDIMIKKKH